MNLESRFERRYQTVAGACCIVALTGGADRLIHWGGLAVLTGGAMFLVLFTAGRLLR